MLTLTRQNHGRSSTTSHATTRQPRVLCIDDDPDIQTAIELRLRNYDVEVEHAFYGMQGIAESHRNHPDLILMDLAMPNGDGLYLLDCLKRNQATADIPVIVLTGMRDPQLRGRAMAAGAEAFLRKPIAFNELLSQMREFIELRSREIQEARRYD